MFYKMGHHSASAFRGIFLDPEVVYRNAVASRSGSHNCCGKMKGFAETSRPMTMAVIDLTM
jgi:hypothetical protein